MLIIDKKTKAFNTVCHAEVLNASNFCIPSVISLRALSVGEVDMLLKSFMSGFGGGIMSIAVVCIK